MNKERITKEYIIITNKSNIFDIKITLERVFKGRNKNYFNIISKFMSNSRVIIRNDNRIALIRFFNSETLQVQTLDGLRANLIVVDSKCVNEIHRISMCISLASDGESLILCEESLHQLFGNILTFLEGVDVNV